MGAQMLVISSSGIVMMSMINAYGAETAAAYGVAVQLWTYVQMPAMAIGAAVSSMAAQNVGAGKWDRVERSAHSGILINVLLTGSLGGAALSGRSVHRGAVPAGAAARGGDRRAHQHHRRLELHPVRRDLRAVRRGALDRRGDAAAHHPHRSRSSACASASPNCSNRRGVKTQSGGAFPSAWRSPQRSRSPIIAGAAPTKPRSSLRMRRRPRRRD